MNLVWKFANGAGTQWWLYVSGILVGTVAYDGCLPREEKDKYKVFEKITGWTNNNVRFHSDEVAKRAVEIRVIAVIKKLYEGVGTGGGGDGNGH